MLKIKKQPLVQCLCHQNMHTQRNILLIVAKRCMFVAFCSDEDHNGVIDQEELKKCFSELEISFTEEEIKDLFEACDVNDDMGMKFNEFIVLLCLVYLFKNDPIALRAVSIIHSLCYISFLLCHMFFFFEPIYLSLCCYLHDATFSIFGRYTSKICSLKNMPCFV